MRTRSRSLPVPDIPRTATPLIPQLRSVVSKQSSSLEALGACDWLLPKEAGRADWTVWSANHHGQRRSLEASASHARVCRCSNLKAPSLPRCAPAGRRVKAATDKHTNGCDCVPMKLYGHSTELWAFHNLDQPRTPESPREEEPS